MTDTIRPVFLISLPRSGSTLLQKMLAVAPEITTTAEPWICLPLATMVEPSVIKSRYWHRTCEQALTDLLRELPGGESGYRKLAGDFVRAVYSQLAGNSGATLFLDKTPRYYWIVPFLAEAFPDGKFIFLFRNPLEVLSSILVTWHRNRIGPGLLGNWLDIVEGPRAMSEGYRLLGERAIGIHYSDLVADPESTLREICGYLQIAYSSDMLTKYQEIELGGQMGDQVGVHAYASVSVESRDKWKGIISNSYRKRYAKQYLVDMGREVLSDFGIDLDQALREIDAVHAGIEGVPNDMLGMLLIRFALYKNSYSYTGLRRLIRGKGMSRLPYG